MNKKNKAIILGLITFVVSSLFLKLLGSTLWKLPKSSDPEIIEKFINNAPTSFFFWVPATYFFATFFGIIESFLIQKVMDKNTSKYIVIIATLYTIFTSLKYPLPTWLLIIKVISPILGALTAWLFWNILGIKSTQK